jgi:hypothetical protein
VKYDELEAKLRKSEAALKAAKESEETMRLKVQRL